MTTITASIIGVSLLEGAVRCEEGWTRDIAIVEFDSPDVESQDEDGNAVLLRATATIEKARALAAFILGPELELRIAHTEIQDWKVLDG